MHLKMKKKYMALSYFWMDQRLINKDALKKYAGSLGLKSKII